MKGWKINKPFSLIDTEIEESVVNNNQSKIRITKALITLSDVLRFNGELETDEIVLGSNGLGVVTETEPNLFGLEKGKRVFVESVRCCETCYNCKKGDKDKCSNMQVAGEAFDGFLRDFVSTSPDNLYLLPDSVDDTKALFIDQISTAIAIFDQLDIKKGDYVAVLGANNFANIFAQLLIYHQAVPIVLTTNEKDYVNAKNSGIYYVLGEDDNWQKEVYTITSGRMTDKVVYVSDCDISLSRAFSLASFNAQVAFTGVYNKSTSVSFLQAIKKQLDILFINNGYGNTATAINLLANKVINFDYLNVNTASYKEVPSVLTKASKDFESDLPFYETVIEMI
jgi:threonine dehydrogenase-like Zn-dependent dehydrogenase